MGPENRGFLAPAAGPFLAAGAAFFTGAFFAGAGAAFFTGAGAAFLGAGALATVLELDTNLPKAPLTPKKAWTLRSAIWILDEARTHLLEGANATATARRAMKAKTRANILTADGERTRGRGGRVRHLSKNVDTCESKPNDVKPTTPKLEK